MEDVVKYIIQLLLTFLTGMVSYICNQYFGLRNGMRSLLKNEIIRTYEFYTKLGYCPSFVKESIKEIYENYHKLKGNGMGTSMVNEIYKLPNEPRELK